MRYRVALAVCLALALTGAMLEFEATRNGPDVSPDSVAYLSTANNIAHGRGVTTPAGVQLPADPSTAATTPDGSNSEAMTIFAPFYPVVLSPLVRPLGLERAGRFLGIALFALLLFLAGWVPYMWTRRTAALWLGPLLVVCAPDLLDVYANVESEVLFLVLLLIAVFWLTRHVARPDRRILLLAAVAVALAVLTRYAGAGLIPGGIAVLLWQRERAWRTRFADVVLFGVVATGPIALWFVRNAVRGSAAERTIRLHLPTRQDVREALQSLRSWVLSGHASTIVSLALVAVVLVVLVWLAWLGRDEAGDVPRVLAVLAVCYLGSVLVSKSLFDASTPLDQRIFTPVHLLVLVAFTQLLALRLPEGPLFRGALPSSAALLGAVLVVVAVARGGTWVHDMQPERLEFASPAWRDSPLAAAARKFDEPIFTNAADGLYFEDGRASYALPQVSNPQSQLVNRDLQPQLDDMQTFLRDHRGVVVYFESVNWRPYLPTETTLERDAGLHVLAREPDGVILGP